MREGIVTPNEHEAKLMTVTKFLQDSVKQAEEDYQAARMVFENARAYLKSAEIALQRVGSALVAIENTQVEAQVKVAPTNHVPNKIRAWSDPD